MLDLKDGSGTGLRVPTGAPQDLRRAGLILAEGRHQLRWKLTLLIGAVIAVSLAHYLTPVGGHGDHAYHANHAIYRWFYHLPIILAAFWFGFPGGLITALGVTALYLPHILFQWKGGSAEQWLEIVLYLVVGAVTGTLAQKLRGQRDRHRLAAEELDRAYRELREKTRVLLERESELRHADRLATLGQLSASMAHEVKTPLASIRGASEILVGDSADASDKREFSEILVREVDRLNSVVARYLNVARPRPKSEDLVDVGETVGEVLELVRAEARRCQVRLHWDGSPRPRRARIDSQQLRQVLLNLIVNSLHAMEGNGGDIRIQVDLVDHSVRVVVADSGPGIPQSIRDRILEPFVTSRQEGTGLGLAIVKRIVESHGGVIEIRSDEEGTKAELRLPAEERTSGN